MKLGKSEIGADLLRNETGKTEGDLQARIEILRSEADTRILLFQDDQGAPGQKSSRTLNILKGLRLVVGDEALIKKVQDEELSFADLASSRWPHSEDSVVAFRPEIGIIPIALEVEGLDRPMSLLRGTFLEIPGEWHEGPNGYMSGN